MIYNRTYYERLVVNCQQFYKIISQVQSHLSLLCMHRYFIKTPWIIKQLFPAYVWSLPAANNTVYLTFDDGPHPIITPVVLDELKKYNAKATFFCLGKNVEQHPEIYQRILAEGHAVGNHTYNHLNGWKTRTTYYMQDVSKAAISIQSHLFRPPYGKIKRRQAAALAKSMGTKNAQVIMWDVLSADFDTSVSQEQCLQYVLKNTIAGSVVVFHDSEKAAKNLLYVLPRVLQLLSAKGCLFKKIGE
jgi:peptidoglycan/xylan/chitin deacetylase (PgdA/CDA1 family)